MPGKVAKSERSVTGKACSTTGARKLASITTRSPASSSTRSTARSRPTKSSSAHYKGRRKWENLRQIPTQQMRDALMNMIVYQGDTEFASVEQQRHLFETAPTDWDRRALTRVMIEEMRHGWQMCALLIDHFGYTGKVEAQKMLERRAFENKRLLGAFNVDVDNWMDFFTYTDFVDRDGKFQLQMLKYSAFAPLGRSMSLHAARRSLPHGHRQRRAARASCEAGVIPGWLIQKYLNKWISSSYDLFGTDHSSSAHWAYVWGIKGRYDEPQERRPADLDESERLQSPSLSRRSGWADGALQRLPQGGRSPSCTRRTLSSIAPSASSRRRSSTPRRVPLWATRNTTSTLPKSCRLRTTRNCCSKSSRTRRIGLPKKKERAILSRPLASPRKSAINL